MSDDTWTRDEVESPCIRVCMIHSTAGLCVGCLRSRDEIAAWSRMDRAERRRILADLPGRKERIARRRGGRAARLKQRD